MRLIIHIFITAIIFGCKPRNEDTETKYAIRKQLDIKGSIYELINKKDASLKVCLFNEDPSSTLGRNYLNYLEEDFRDGLYSWTSVAAEHPSWIGPSKPQITFKRIRFGDYIDTVARLRESLDPTILSRVQKFIAESHKDMGESYARYAKIIGDVGPEIKRLSAEQFGCQSSISIFGFTSKVKAMEAFDYVDPRSKDYFFLDETLKKQFTNLWTILTVDLETNPQIKENRRNALMTIKMQREEGMWNRASAYINLKIVIGMANYTGSDAESLGPGQQIPEFRRHVGKWIMNHEIGHLFLLGDVYIEPSQPSALNRHPNALMGNHLKAQGKIQPDDRSGLFAVLDSLTTGKIKPCGRGYTTLDNRVDSRSNDFSYCIPMGVFQNQVDMDFMGFPINIGSSDQVPLPGVNPDPRLYPKPSLFPPGAPGPSSEPFPLPGQK